MGFCVNEFAEKLHERLAIVARQLHSVQSELHQVHTDESLLELIQVGRVGVYFLQIQMFTITEAALENTEKNTQTINLVLTLKVKLRQYPAIYTNYN